MIDKKYKKELEQMAKKYGIELVGVCSNCGERWGTLEEWKVINDCETCKKDGDISLFAEVDDVFRAIKRLKK